MRLQALTSFLLPVLFAIALAPPTFAQSPSDAELDAMYNRFGELYRAGKYNEAIPLAERFADATAARFGENAREHATALYNLAELLKATHRPFEAEPWLRRLLAIDEKNSGPDDPKVARDLHSLAGLLYTTNRLLEAEPLLRRSIAIEEKNSSPDDPDVARDLNSLAGLLYNTNRSSEAEPLLRRSLGIEEKNFGPDHPHVADVLNNLAGLLSATNRLSEAEPLMRRLLAIDEKNSGPDDPKVARDLTGLARLLNTANRSSEAEPLYRRALAIIEKTDGPDDPKVAVLLNNLAKLLQATNRLAEAEPLMHRALTIAEKSSSPDGPEVAAALGNLAKLLQDTNRLAEAEPLMRRALAIAEKKYGPDDPNVAIALNDVAQLLQATNRLSEAEPLMHRALANFEKGLGPNHPHVAAALNNLARLFQATNRFSEAEPLLRRALAIDEKSLVPGHPDVARDLNNLALLLWDTNRLAEAELLYRRALATDEKSFGPDHPKVANSLNNLATLLHTTNHLSEAEPLMRRALAIDEKSFGPDHPEVAIGLGNLAVLLYQTSRRSKAEPMMRRALAINEKSFGPDHPEVAAALSALAQMLYTTNRLSEAEPLMRRALAIDEKSFGPDHPVVASSLQKLALLLEVANRLSEAEPLCRRALAIQEKSMGPDHPHTAEAVNGLAGLLEEQGRWPEAAALFRKAKLSMARRVGGPERGGLRKAVLAQNTNDLRTYARALYRAGASDAANLSEGFEGAQWALQNEAADALSAMAARFAKGGEQLGKLVREEQDLVGAHEAAYRSLDAAEGKADSRAAETTRAGITQIEARLAEKQAALRLAFPDYAEFANPKPLGLTDAQALLSERDALVLFLNVPRRYWTPGEIIVFALTNKEARWTSISLGADVLLKRVAALRCGLDTGHWRSAGRQKCRDLTGKEPSYYPWGDAIADTLPFDTAAAHALYRDLFSGVEDLVAGKRLLIVPSGALTQLPFEVLVTEKPAETLPRSEAYEKAAWLGRRQAITILPSVASLKALRAAKASEAPEPFAGFGNPLLTGLDGADKSAWDKQDCSKAAPLTQTRGDSLAVSVESVFRGGAVNVEKLRRQPPLPETAEELCRVGRALGEPESGLEKAIHLGKEATVSKVKALSRSGDLARARVVHFATHGLLAFEAEGLGIENPEPALLLTPPAEASEEDNGLLTASEVAQLNLDADWVVMSACNTAGGTAERREALSGLARAFFYAGARALLVSHWYVDSKAAVAITTGAVNAMKSNPKIGRAEALRSAETALIAQGDRFAHPSVWAPFVLVGNGEQ